jgi:hypothetical protein
LAQLALLAISLVFVSSSVSTMRSLLARSEEPVSVMSTIASTRSGTLTSVCAHENSHLATLTPFCSKKRLVVLTNSVATRLPARSAGHLTEEASGTQSTQRDFSVEARLYTRSQTSTTSELFSSTQSWPVETAVEKAVFDVTADFLRAHKTAIEFGIIDRRAVAARAGRNFPTSLRKEGLGGLFQAAFRQTQHQEWSLDGHNPRRTRRRKVVQANLLRTPPLEEFPLLRLGRGWRRGNRHGIPTAGLGPGRAHLVGI